MRPLFIVAMFATVTGCVDSSSEKEGESLSSSQLRGTYIIEHSTIERHNADSDTVALYTPGSNEIGFYNPVTDQISVVPANSDNVSRLLKGGGNDDDRSSDTGEGTTIDTLTNRSIHSRAFEATRR